MSGDAKRIPTEINVGMASRHAAIAIRTISPLIVNPEVGIGLRVAADVDWSSTTVVVVSL
jgi:hypothetical protein